MSPFRLSRRAIRALSLTAISVLLVTISLAWASRQQASSPSLKPAGNHSAPSLFADKGGITPEAATITVNTLSDVANAGDGLCTLREAITAANNNAASGAAAGECAAGSSSGSDTIDMTGVTGTINLTAALPDIASDLAINGPGSAQLTVRRSSSDLYRIFNIASGTVGISGLTAKDGSTPNANGGGGVKNAGTLTMIDVVVNSNQAGSFGSIANGGGVFNQGTLSMTNCAVTGNATVGGASNPGQGGGVHNVGTLTMTNCLVSGNQTGASIGGTGGLGGGISNQGPMTLTGTTISNNVTGLGPNSSGQGGGINNSASATLINCSVKDNQTGPGGGGTGGGINHGGGTLTVIGSTISGNTGGFAGGIENEQQLTLINSTISGNSQDGLDNNNSALAILINCTVTGNTVRGVQSNNGTARFRNTLAAGNAGEDVGGNCISQGHNLIGAPEASICFTNGVNSDQVGTLASPLNPHIGPLANNGGPAMTHALLANSPALDAGDNCVTDASHCGDANISQLTSDQRGAGFNRLVDGPDGDTTATVDIGAFEMQTPLANLADTSTNEDTQLLVAFDGSGVTSVDATSSDGNVVPNDAAHLSAAILGSTVVLTINPVTNAHGPTNITVTVNGGAASKAFLLTVNAANDAPAFTIGADQTVNEDAGAQTVPNWATSISPGPSDESGQAVNFNVTNNNPTLFSVAPAISPTGTLTYTPAANANGSATVTVTAKDNGGTANGGVDSSAPQTFAITVTAINDAPSFTKGADQPVNEDAGSQSVANWATAISAGPANELGQTVTFTVTNNNNALFSSQPAVSATGTLTYTPAPSANGSATVTVTAKDNGGTANGGNDTSPPQTFTITVTAVNDAPSFTKGANQTVNEDAGAQAFAGWATAISSGPADESGQTVSFTVTNNLNSLFSVQPAVSSNGTLTYTPAADANGSATVTVTAKDNGGTANGGVDSSAPQTFTITVTAINDAPSFTKGVDQSASNAGGPQTLVNWATNISAGPGNESSQTVTFQVTGNTNPSLFTAGPAVSSSGTLTYTPSTSAGGTATITLVGKDNGGTTNGGVDTSAAQSFTITIVPIAGFFSFQSSSSNTTENSGVTTVNVIRSGNLSGPATVNYATNADSGVPCSTANGVASPKCDFTAALGTLSFAAGETSKPITILISQDSFVEGPETITVTLSSPTAGAALATPSSMTVAIADDATEPPTNVIDDANMFVRMHYHDFLNREADQSGLDFWTGQMTNCGNSDLTVCRINVSGAFFLSIEFQQTGYLVERIYKTGYGDAQGTSQIGGAHQIFVPIVRANEFLADTQRVGRGVVVGQTGWETVLENNKQAYALEFVQTSRFITAFPTTMTPAQFVDQLNTNAGGVLSVSERQTVINLFGNSVNTTNVTARAQALRQVAEDADLFNAEANRAFVLTQYIGYMRRNPNDAPDSDYSGYDFWLGKLVQFNGNYVAAEMVKAFISSPEYRQRFGP